MVHFLLTILVAFAISLTLGPVLLPILKKMKFGQQVRQEGPQTHLSKSGTPTMGGILIIVATVVTILIFSPRRDPYMLAAMAAFLGYGLIGFADDYIKISRKRSMGLTAWQKIIAQLILAFLLSLFAYRHTGTHIMIPFTEHSIDLGIWFIPWTVFVLIAMTNSVNLTDGLDGLLSGISLIVLGALAAIFTYQNNVLSQSMLMLCGALIGACLGFLRFNVFPARVFMGDTGSLALGGIIAYLGIVSGYVLLLPIMGGCFVASSVSVIIQVVSYKTRGKRVFKMAPLHHHFELLGNPETKITAMYMIVTGLLCIIALLSIR